MWEGRVNTNSEQREANNDDEITVTSPKPHVTDANEECIRASAAPLPTLRKLDWKAREGMVATETEGRGVTEGTRWRGAASALQPVQSSLILRF
jgi:hypothetical protein